MRSCSIAHIKEAILLSAQPMDTPGLFFLFLFLFVSANYAADNSLDGRVFYVNWFHLFIRRLEADASLFSVVSFKCCIFIIYKSYYYVAIFGVEISFNNNVVAVQDTIIDHGFSAHLEYKAI